MERRRAVAIAAVTVATTLTAVAAVAANFGLLGFGAAGSKPVGQLDAGRVAEVFTPAASPTAATASAPNVTVRYEDIYVPAPAAPITTVAADTGAVTAEDPGLATGGDESGEGHDDDHDRAGGDHEGSEEEDD
jgi:hypothetical protein